MTFTLVIETVTPEAVSIARLRAPALIVTVPTVSLIIIDAVILGSSVPFRAMVCGVLKTVLSNRIVSAVPKAGPVIWFFQAAGMAVWLSGGSAWLPPLLMRSM